MNKFRLLVTSSALGLTIASAPAQATEFFFSGVSNDGTASATMDIFNDSSDDTKIIAELNNTSPITTSSGNVNTPGFTAFGFDLDPSDLTFEGWSLFAFDSNNNSVQIDNNTGGTGDWILTICDNGTPGCQVNGIKVDYAPNTDPGSDVKGALYNPLATSGFAAPPNYFTEAILTLDFASTPTLNTTRQESPFIFAQNVGENGEGSLKLFGSEEEGGGGFQEIPEPGMLGLLGIGLLGMGLARRRRIQ